MDDFTNYVERYLGRGTDPEYQKILTEGAGRFDELDEDITSLDQFARLEQSDPTNPAHVLAMLILLLRCDFPANALCNVTRIAKEALLLSVNNPFRSLLEAIVGLEDSFERFVVRLGPDWFVDMTRDEMTNDVELFRVRDMHRKLRETAEDIQRDSSYLRHLMLTQMRIYRVPEDMSNMPIKPGFRGKRGCPEDEFGCKKVKVQ